MGSENHKTQVLTYPIASGGMCYTVENERTVYLEGDLQTGYNLYGQIPGTSEASAANLAEVLLEFAMTWNSPGDPSEARRQMHVFGEHIGEALGKQSTGDPPVDSALASAALALEDVLLSLDHTNGHVRFQLDQSPLRAAAEATGLEPETELAHHAFTAICRSLVSEIDPQLQVQLPGDPNAEQTISLTAPATNGR
jgi:hypothetical protein